MKKKIILFFFILSSCAKVHNFYNTKVKSFFSSVSSLRTADTEGFYNQKLKKTDNIHVRFVGFLTKYRLNQKIDMNYKITLELPNIESLVGKYVIVKFRMPNKKKQYETQIILLSNTDRILYVKSSLMFGFKSGQTYDVLITLANDQYGYQVIENIEQPVLVDCIPYGFINSI